jgi:hypothetical protein
MSCLLNCHIWLCGGTTTDDPMPPSLRCACGALTRAQANPLLALQAENARLRTVLADTVRAFERAVEGIPGSAERLDAALSEARRAAQQQGEGE